MSLPSDMASACCNMMRAASSNQFVAGRHADRSPLARLQLFTARDCSRFSAVCPNGRACPQVDHTRRPSPRPRRSCDVSALTRGLTAVLRVISATIRFSVVHTQHTRCAVGVRTDPPTPRSANPPTSGRPCDHSTTRGGRGAGRAHGAGAPGRVTGRARDATTRTDNRIESNVFPVSRAVRAHEHARPQTRDAARGRRTANRRLRIRVECAARARHAHPTSTGRRMRARADS